MRPEIICHIMSSVDGRLLPSRWTPPFDGLTTAPSIFEYLGASDEHPAAGQSLELLSAEPRANGIVWLRYKFHHGNTETHPEP